MRYFIEVAYKGSRYAGFQIQKNAPTIQLEVEKALQVFYKQSILLTGSSRTDAGVHAMQNYFQADTIEPIFESAHIYNLNAILPDDIVIKSIRRVADDLHCRFHADYRLYHYRIYFQKHPFLTDRAWFVPYPINIDLLNAAANILMQFDDFTSFSKRNTQTHTNLCKITESHWRMVGEELVYAVKSNRFLRGMVRGAVGTMLQVGRQKISIQEFTEIIQAKDCTRADFSTPAHGLYLMEVGFKGL